MGKGGRRGVGEERTGGRREGVGRERTGEGVEREGRGEGGTERVECREIEGVHSSL